jgi:hypothetical protein
MIILGSLMKKRKQTIGMIYFSIVQFDVTPLHRPAPLGKGSKQKEA